MSRGFVLLLIGGVGLIWTGAPAQATFPGENGKIAVTQGPAPFRIATVNPDGTGLAQITSGSDANATWSADGQWLAFYRVEVGRPGRSLRVMRADGSDQRTLLDGQRFNDTAPAWSPDGLQIAVEHPGDGTALKIFDLNGGSRDLLVQPNGPGLFVRDPDWSPDGTRIAFEGELFEFVCDPFEPGECDFQRFGADIYTVNADGSGTARLTFDGVFGEPPQHFNSQPSWSPDGGQIAFKRDRGIAVMNADGTGVRELVDFGWGPVWSPDGTKIAFSGNDLFDVFVMNPDGTGLTKLLDGAAPPAPFFNRPSWQPIPNRPPDCSSVVASPAVLWPANKKLRLVTLADATDPDGDPVTLEVTGVAHDEPAREGSDWAIHDDVTALLRAERDPKGDGRTYTVSFEATDEHGASCTGTATVSVPRHKR